MGDHPDMAMPSAPTPRVVIIGAGIAGLSAAARLIQRGVRSVTVLEATERAGGRIWTVPDDGTAERPSLKEMGAQWIHGIHDNPVFKFAKQHKLLKSPNSKNSEKSPKTPNNRYKVLALTDRGQEVSGSVIKEVFGRFHVAFEEAEAVFQTPEDVKTPDRGVGGYIQDKMQPWISSFPKEESELRRSILHHRFMWETGISGCDQLDDISVNMFGGYKELDGPDLVFPTGFSSVIHTLLKQIPNDSVLLNHAVTHVAYQEVPLTQQDCSDFVGTRQQAPCRVTCRNGVVLEADCVMVTTSLGFLQENLDDFFRPQLPEWKESAIQGWAIGTVDKIFLEFEDFDFLPDQVNSLQLIWRTCDADNEESMESSWFKKIHNVYVNSMEPKPTLCTWITGRAAEYMETLGEEEVGRACQTMMSHFLQTEVPAPSKVIRTNWYTNPYTRGSYSYPPVNSTTEVQESLAAPICHPSTNKPLLLFAGEATHAEFYSTTHGALLSGQTQADLIVDSFLGSEAAQRSIP